MSPHAINPSGHEWSETRDAFQTTHWSVVLQARQATGTGRQALGVLFSKYWSPVYLFIRRSGFKSSEAEDLTQEFFFRVLQRDWLGNVNPSRGKFRSFVMTCVKNFLCNQHERSSAVKRGGNVCFLPLGSENLETRYCLEPPDPATPEVMFERQWATELLEQTIALLRREFVESNRLDWFEQLQGFLPGGISEVTRAELAQRRGLSANAIDVAVYRIRKRFGVLLRNRIAETVSSEAEIDEEIRHLISVLSRWH